MDKVDSQLKVFLQDLANLDSGPGLFEGAIEAARESDVELFRQFLTVKKVDGIIDVENLIINEGSRKIPVRFFKPVSVTKKYPVIIFIHGGGWTLGDIQTRDASCREISVLTGACIVSVEYKLAPENHFPSALDECYFASSWVWDNSEKLDIDRSSFLVMGDSAGGNLAAALANRSAAFGKPGVTGQVLLYPVVDLTSTNTPSYKEFGENHFVTKELMEWFINAYVPDNLLRNNPEVSPLLAQFKTLPAKAFIVTAECDVLRDEGEAYARKLEQSGVEVIMHRYKSMIHGFFDMPMLSDAAAEYRREIIQITKKML